MAITNPYYEFTPEFTPGTKARAEDVNRQYQALQTAFDLLPGDADALITNTAVFAPETGSGNAYVVTMPDTRTANTDGDQVVFYATHTNTGAATLAVDAVAPVALTNWDGDAFTGGEIISGRLYSVRYDATNTRFVLEATLDAALQVEWAEEWAQQLEDVPVSVAAGGDGVTDFSAFHWAQKAQASAVTGRINTDIVTATPPTTELVTGGLEIWDNDDTDQLALLGFSASSELLLHNYFHGGTLQLRGENTSGVETALLLGDPDGALSFYDAGIERVRTSGEGLRIYADESVVGQNNTSISARIEFWDADKDSFVGSVGYGDNTTDPSSELTLAGYMTNGIVSIQRTNFSGTLVDVFRASSSNTSIYGGQNDIYLAPGSATIISADAGGYMQAFSSTLEVLRTTSQAGGGLTLTQTYNNNTGTRERALSEADLQAGYRLYMGKGFGTTATDPGASLFRWNNADLSLATEFYISATDEANWDADVILGMQSAGDLITVSDHKGRDEYLVMKVTGAPTDNTGWWTIPVEYVKGVTAFTSGSTNDPFIVEFTATSGASSVPDGTTAGTTLKWDDTAGEWVESTELRIKNTTGSKPQIEVYANQNNNSVPEAGIYFPQASGDCYLIGASSTDDSDEFGIVWELSPTDTNEKVGFYWLTFGDGTLPMEFGKGYVDLVTSKHRLGGGYHKMFEVASVASAGLQNGTIWVKNTVPTTLWFTDSTGVEYQLNNIGASAQTVSALWTASGGGDLSAGSGGFITVDGGDFRIKEAASGPTAAATYGYLWVTNAASQIMYFRDDAGVDFQLGGGTTQQFNVDLHIRGGNSLAIYDSGNDDFFDIIHTGTQVEITTTGTGAGPVPIKVLPGSDYFAIGGENADSQPFRVADADMSDYWQVLCNGTDILSTITGGGQFDFGDHVLREVTLRDYAIEDTSVTPTGTTQTITYSTSNSYQIDLESATGNMTVTISGGPPAGTYGQMVVIITQDSTVARTVTWAGGTFRWPGGSTHPMTTTLNGFTIYTFETWDGGTTWYGTGADYA